MGMKDLDDSQKASLATIQEAHKRGATAIHREMEDAWEKREASIKPQDMFGGGGMGGMRGGRGMFDDERSQELRDRRRELDDSTVDKIKAVLKPEQFEQLPRGREDRGGGAGGEDAPRRQRNNNGDGGGQQNGDRPARPARPPTGRT